jgi:hypothetical protein
MPGRKLELSIPPSFGDSRSASTANAARACDHEMPAFRRATVAQPLLPGLKAAGFQTMAFPG